MSRLGFAALIAAGLLLYASVSAPAHSRAASGQISGALPVNGGFALIVWGGGTPDQLVSAAAHGGCGLRGIFATSAGRFVPYVVGAPAFANTAFTSIFSGTEIPAGTALLLRCARSGVTPLPAPVPAPSATSTPTPSPTATVLSFSSADGGTRSLSGQHTGFLGIVYAQAVAGYNPSSRSMQVGASIPNIGINEHPAASAWLWNDFTVGGGPSGSLTAAQFDASASWHGFLSGNGIAGTSATIEIQFLVLDRSDGSRVVGSKSVHSRTLQQSGLTLGGVGDVGDGNVDFSVKVIRGHTYRFEIEATCRAGSGAIAAQAACSFAPASFLGIRTQPGFVNWTAASVTYQ